MKRRGPDDRLCIDRFFAPLHRKPVLLIVYYSVRPGGYFHEPKNTRMRLSVVFELLLVFLFLAFAAARVIDPSKGVKNVAKDNKKIITLRQGPPNRYCACTSRMCNCCRDFSLPVVPLKGPGCASIMYVQRDTMMVTMSFGDRVLSNTTISGKTPKPICMALPGGISQFCGRIYGISRKGDQFRACLGLELRALDDIEAALRVSCFKFGPKGVRLESAPPVPAETGNKDPDEEDEDDYDLDDDEDDDLIGFGVDDEDDGGSSEDNEVDSDSVDYTGFSVLGEDILGTFFSDDSESSSAKKKKPSKKTAKPQAVVPQIVLPKVSSTTRRPILPNRRKSTVRPLSSVTKRPLLNRVTKRPSISTSRPQILQRPLAPVISSNQLTVQSTLLPVSPTVVTEYDIDKKIITKSPSTTTEAPATTMRVVTTEGLQASEKLQTSAEVSQETTVVTEEPITFTIPTQKIDIVKNVIKLPQTDLAKVEAVAAIAQQDVTSGVISSSSLSSEKTEKPIETATVKYEKITSSHSSSPTPPYSSEIMEKISSIKFIPTTVATSRPSAEMQEDHSSSDKITESEIATITESELANIKNKITVHQQSTISYVSNEKTKDDISKYEEIDQNDIEKNSQIKKGNLTFSLKKQPVKKPVKEEDEEEEEEEEDEEGEEDILEGVLSDDDDSDNEEAEENDDNLSQTSSNKIKNEANNDEEEEEEEESDDEDDILGETVGSSQKVKPSKVSIKKKPASDESDNEEEEEEEDILDVLGDDDEEEESDEDDDETEKDKNKKKPTTQTTTVKIRRPTTQATTQTRKPVTTTEKRSPSTTAAENLTEKMTEKIFIYKEPIEKVTEKIIIYKEPENKISDKIFIYKDPGNQINQKTTEKIIFYKEPEQQSVTEKFVIFREPEEKITEKPAIIINDDSKSSEETKDDSEEDDRVESDDENSSEEELEDENPEKHTLVASIMKPEFSNKYAAEHDLTESDDLDIEDSEDDGNDFQEDRKMKDNRKKPLAKSPTNKKSDVQINKPKILSLSDLIGQRKKYNHLNDDKPISTSRTHRRMNLDRLLQF